MKQSTEVFASEIGKIGIFLGGRSQERAVSLRSGNAIYRALANAGFHVSKIDTSNGFLKTLKSKDIDFGFPALHGTGGEDGALQRILDRHRIPYVGSGVRASWNAFNKWNAKKRFVRLGIPTPEFRLVTRRNFKRLLQTCPPPYVLKPLTQGSSIDVVMIHTAREGQAHLRKLLHKYSKVLMEQKIVGRELTVAILGKRALPVIEIKSKRQFYDYRAKYEKGFTDYLVPAPLPPALTKQVKWIALRVHRCLGLRDFSRVDMIVDPSGRPYVLEVNSIPGFTETSLLPKAADSAGLNFTDLCVYLLKTAYERTQKRF